MSKDKKQHDTWAAAKVVVNYYDTVLGADDKQEHDMDRAEIEKEMNGELPSFDPAYRKIGEEEFRRAVLNLAYRASAEPILVEDETHGVYVIPSSSIYSVRIYIRKGEGLVAEA